MARSDGTTEVLVEKEDGLQLWIATVGDEFVSKVNSRFGYSYTQQSLFSKMARALTSGSPSTAFDWLTPGDLKSLEQQAGKTANSKDSRDRVLVMIEAAEGNQISIPLPLQAMDEKNERLFKVVKRLKKGAAKKNQGLFLTGAGVVEDQEKDALKDENRRLRSELERMKNEFNGKESTRALGSDSELKSLRSKVAELQIELSALPVLKNQLKDKVRELEVLNMYVREVEICSKIRAPIPNINTYKNSLLGNADIGDLGGATKKPAVTANTRGRQTNQRQVPGTAPVRKSGERKQFLPSRDLAGVYHTQLSTGNSRKTSTSRIQ